MSSRSVPVPSFTALNARNQEAHCLQIATGIEALATVNRAIPARLKRNASFLATGGALGGMECPGIRAAPRAAARETYGGARRTDGAAIRSMSTTD